MTRLMISARFAPFSETPHLAVRHGLPVVEPDAIWYESFAPGAWLLNGRGAQVQFGHNTRRVGDVTVVAGVGPWWHADAIVESDDPKLLERCKVGTPVSVGFDPYRSDDDIDLRLRRHTLARLGHIAILPRGEIPAFADAKIVSVTEAKTKARTSVSGSGGIDWRTVLPREWAEGIDVANLPADAPVSISDSRRGLEWRWDGSKFVVAGAYARAA